MLATQNRIVFLDYLRVVACFMVMAIHSAEPFYLGGAFYRRVVRPVSEASYGMYLLHMFVLAPVSAALIPRLPTPLAIAATAAVSFSVSALAALVLRRMPVIGKWIC